MMIDAMDDQRWPATWDATLETPVRCRAARILLLFSVVSTLTVLFALMAFDDAPGELPPTPGKWPVTSALPRSSGRELLVFVHPFCGCTDATVAELAMIPGALLPSAPPPALTFVVFRPGPDSSWTMSALRGKASLLPRARFVWDDRAAEARRFGVKTSGTVLLYEADGRLLFHGGVTGERGHQGDNFGLSALLGSLRNPAPGSAPAIPRTSAVFGCAIGATAGRNTGILVTP